MRRAVLALVLTCLCVSGWVMYHRETIASEAFRAEMRDYPVIVPYGGVTGPQAAASTGWERIPELPKEPADVVQNRVLKGLDDIQQRWVYLEFDEPVSLGSLKVSWFMLFTRTGFSVSELYVDGGKGGWLHATTTVSAVMVEAYLRDAKTPNPD